MNKKDINNLIRWAVDTNGEKFAKEIYGRNDRDFIDDYTNDKFHLMQKNIIMWIASLDDKNRQHLADAINNNPTNKD